MFRHNFEKVWRGKMSKEQKTLKSCHILDRLREWFELYGNQNHQRAEEELQLAIDELYEYQQKDRQLADLEAKLAEKDKEIKQNKISFTIEQLEKVKKEFNERKLEYITMETKIHIYGLRIDRINELIDNQINELKEMK